MDNNNNALRNLLANRMPLIYSSKYSCSQYFKDRGIKNISVYCEEADYGFAQPICFDLSLSFDVDVKFWLSDAVYTFRTAFPNQNLTASPYFNPGHIDKLTADDNVLILCSELTNETISKIRSKTQKVFHIADIWPDLWWRAIMARRFQEIRNLFPFLPIVLFTEPIYPKNKNAYSDVEKFMSENQPGHYEKSILPRLKQTGASIPGSYEGFGYDVDEIIEMLDATRSYVDGRCLKLKDFSGKMVNISNGHRIVPEQSDNYTRTIYIFGGCTVFGAGCPDHGTLPAHLRKLIVDNGINDLRVENYGAFIYARGKYVFETMKSLPYKPGDILISGFAGVSAVNGVTSVPEGVVHIDTQRIFERPHKWGENVFFDTCHPNERGQFALASVLFDHLSSRNFYEDFADKHQTAPAPQNSSLTSEELTDLSRYIAAIAPLRRKIGAIVMACNPFTLGHRYLIEQSAKKCSQLFIFVVEEDEFHFPFADRIELVRQGTSDIPNVTVVPSGKFIISTLTFVDYFGKSEMQDRTIDPSMDVELFAQKIAPALGITSRFAGEEPLDNVTRQYNEAMKNILPRYGIEFDTIARQECDGQVISASRVRKLLETECFADIAKLVPATTLRYLEKFRSRP